MMDTVNQHLLLWRHADALPISQTILTDIERPLSELGIAQATQTAAWLSNKLPSDTQILCSPAKRTIETAQCLNQAMTISDELAPGADLSEVISTIISAWGASQRNNLLVVGHQPWIGQLAQYVLSNSLYKRATDVNDTPNQSFQRSEVQWFRKPLLQADALFEHHLSKVPST